MNLSRSRCVAPSAVFRLERHGCRPAPVAPRGRSEPVCIGHSAATRPRLCVERRTCLSSRFILRRPGRRFRSGIPARTPWAGGKAEHGRSLTLHASRYTSPEGHPRRPRRTRWAPTPPAIFRTQVSCSEPSTFDDAYRFAASDRRYEMLILSYTPMQGHVSIVSLPALLVVGETRRLRTLAIPTPGATLWFTSKCGSKATEAIGHPSRSKHRRAPRTSSSRAARSEQQGESHEYIARIHTLRVALSFIVQ